MSFFPEVNRYTNEEARHAWFASFAIFALWWIFSLLSGIFHHRHHGIPAVNAVNGTTATPWGYRLERITHGLERVFISSLAVVVFNYLTNGITRNFNIIHWIALWIGFFWALARGFFGRFGDLLQLLVIPLFVLLWVFTFVDKFYIGINFW
jgi:hypothetical protein